MAMSLLRNEVRYPLSLMLFFGPKTHSWKALFSLLLWMPVYARKMECNQEAKKFSIEVIRDFEPLGHFHLGDLSTMCEWNFSSCMRNDWKKVTYYFWASTLENHVQKYLLLQCSPSLEKNHKKFNNPCPIKVVFEYPAKPNEACHDFFSHYISKAWTLLIIYHETKYW